MSGSCAGNGRHHRRLASHLRYGRQRSGWELIAIASCVIGGVSLIGGQGRIIGVVAGAALLVVLRDGLVAVNVNAYYQSMVVGLVLLFAIVVDRSGSDVSNVPGGTSAGPTHSTRSFAGQTRVAAGRSLDLRWPTSRQVGLPVKPGRRAGSNRLASFSDAGFDRTSPQEIVASSPGGMTTSRATLGGSGPWSSAKSPHLSRR